MSVRDSNPTLPQYYQVLPFGRRFRMLKGPRLEPGELLFLTQFRLKINSNVAPKLA